MVDGRVLARGLAGAIALVVIVASEAPRSAGVVIVARNQEWSVLMLRAYRNWDFPKGMIEPGEGKLAAALREVKEETGIDRGELSFRWGDVCYETPPYNKGKIATYFLAEMARRNITLPVSDELGRPEHDEWRWFSFSAARQIAMPRIQAVLVWAERVVNNGSN